MYGRLTIAALPVERMKESRQVIAERFPAMTDLRGLKNAYAVPDEATGKFVGLTLYETEAGVMASREAATRSREEVAKVFGGHDFLGRGVRGNRAALTRPRPARSGLIGG